MASDEDYTSFLEKANRNPGEGVGTVQDQGDAAKKPFKTTDAGAQIPEPLAKVAQTAFYTSDADEPFEAVALAWDEAGKGLPGPEEFAALIGHWDPGNADMDLMGPAAWDGRGQYREVVDAVRSAGGGNEVGVYRVGRGGVRAEYWVLTTEGKGAGARLVGLKALAIES